MSTTHHPSIVAFGTQKAELVVGTYGITRLAERVGSTPFFAYDRRLLTSRVEQVRRALPGRVCLSYAIKANPMPAVVNHMAGLVDGLDVASALEMKTALDTQVAPEHVSFAGPGKTPDELGQAIAAGVLIEIESETELRRIAAIAEKRGVRPKIAVRINPDFAIRGAAMRMGGGASQFGIDAALVPAICREVRDLDLEFVGMHIFSGSQILDAELLSSIQARTIDLALRIARESEVELHHLNIGGGFGVPYFPKDRPLDLSAVCASLADVLNERDEETRDTRIVIELGRYLVAEAGIYVTRIVDRKESRGETFLITDGGLHHQLAASGNFGQVIRRNFPVAIGNRMGATPTETVNVVGCLCTPLDLLAHQVELPRAKPGDLFVVFLSGAYGLSASPTAFLSHPVPLEVLV